MREVAPPQAETEGEKPTSFSPPVSFADSPLPEGARRAFRTKVENNMLKK